jgi:hypothetical protein
VRTQGGLQSDPIVSLGPRTIAVVINYAFLETALYGTLYFYLIVVCKQLLSYSLEHGTETAKHVLHAAPWYIGYET